MAKTFAVGTGRCGMNSWAKTVGGYAESEVALRKLAVDYYQNPETDLSYAYEKFRKRLADPAPGISDCCQFMFINLIYELDPTVKFIWLLRNKKDCVKSFMKKGSEEERIHPKGMIFTPENKLAHLNWYYDEVNYIIHRSLIGKNFEVILTDDLEYKLN